MNNIHFENEIKEIHRFLSSVNKSAYKDIFLIANPVLSKNPYTSNYLDYFLNKNCPKNISFHGRTWKLTKYYIKSLAHFGMYLLRFFIFYLSSVSFRFNHDRNELVLVDVFFMVEKIDEARYFRDTFFPGLEKLLINGKKNYAYLPFFYASSYNKNPFEFQRCLAILRNGKIPMLTEYQLLSGRDLVRLFHFLIVYPFRVLRFAKTLNNGEYPSKLLKYELVNTIENVTFHNFSRFLQGRRIAALPYDRIKVISWYENQPIHKYLYKGLKTGSCDKVKIYGAQLFLCSNRMLNLIPDENEIDCGLLPDKIIVNGPHYVCEGTKLNYSVGPSFRYAGMFDIAIKEELRKNVLVLLPYFIEDARNILQVLLGSKFALQKIFIKAHPATPLDSIKQFIPSNAVVVEKGIYQLLETTKIVIGAASGTMIEAASIGIPVISIKNGKRFEWNNPLPEYGKGIIWEEAVNAEGLDHQIERFEKKLKECPKEINEVAARYKEMFFCRPTDENIIKAFEL